MVKTLSVPAHGGDTSPKGGGKLAAYKIRTAAPTWLSLWESWHGEAVTERVFR